MTDKHFHKRGFEKGTTPEGNQEQLHSSKKSGGFLEFLIILLVTFALVFGFVRPFVVEAFYIPTESMVPTLEIGDRVFVNKFVYRFSQPERGNVVVFKSVEGDGDTLIKRIVGVPGDEIRVRNGVLFVNNERWEESYVNDAFPDTSYYGPVRVPPGEVFVMGDNRGNSRDSRFFGPIPIESIEGKAFAIFWPPSHIGLL
jgi:signal peptidase I